MPGSTLKLGGSLLADTLVGRAFLSLFPYAPFTAFVTAESRVSASWRSHYNPPRFPPHRGTIAVPGQAAKSTSERRPALPTGDAVLALLQEDEAPRAASRYDRDGARPAIGHAFHVGTAPAALHTLPAGGSHWRQPIVLAVLASHAATAEEAPESILRQGSRPKKFNRA